MLVPQCFERVTRRQYSLGQRFPFSNLTVTVTCRLPKIKPQSPLSLRAAVAGSTGRAAKGLRDEALSADGRYLYAIDPDAGQLLGWAVNGDGQLSPVGGINGMAATVAGLAAG